MSTDPAGLHCPICAMSLPAGTLMCPADGARPVPAALTQRGIAPAHGTAPHSTPARSTAAGVRPSGRTVARLLVPDAVTVDLRAGDRMRLGRAAPGAVGLALSRYPTVSRHHADLAVLPDAVVVTDAGSAGGTFVEGTWLSAGHSAELTGTGLIRLAAMCVLRVHWITPSVQRS